MKTATERIEAAFPQMSQHATIEQEWLILNVDERYFAIRHEGNCKEERFVLLGSTNGRQKFHWVSTWTIRFGRALESQNG